MRNDILNAIGRINDVSQVSWYQERCGRGTALLTELRVFAMQVGLAIDHRVPEIAPVPVIGLDIEQERFSDDFFRASYDKWLSISCLADVFWVKRHVAIENAAFDRLEPSLDSEPDRPICVPSGPEMALYAELQRRGLRQLSRDELNELVYIQGDREPTSLESALLSDPHNALWHSDSDNEGEGRHADDLPLLVGVPALVHGEHARHQTTSPSWIDEIEVAFARRVRHGHIQRLSPAGYPSVSWTFDFGPMKVGAFHARFYTDLHVSKLVPYWYYADRFVVANRFPNAIQPELTGWTIKQIGYVRDQTEFLNDVKSLLARYGLGELHDSLLWRNVPAPPEIAGYGRVMLGELMFRDPYRVCPPAPALEEESLDRNVKPRTGTLAGGGHDTLFEEMAEAALHAGDEEVEKLLQAHAELDREQRDELERDARRPIVELYFERLAVGIRDQIAKYRDVLARIRSGELVGKERDEIVDKLAAADRVARNIPAARARALADLEVRFKYTNAGEWEPFVEALPAADRARWVNDMARQRATRFQFIREDEISVANRRDVYRHLWHPDRGYGEHLYAVIVETGRYDVTDLAGRHDREINFDGAQTAPREPSGARDLALPVKERIVIPAPPIPWPLGVELADGRWTIVQQLHGTAYRAIGEPNALVALTKVAISAGDLELPVEGVTPLLAVTSITGDAGTLAAVVEAEPPGRPVGVVMPARGRAVAHQLASIVARAHARSFVLAGIRPELIYVDDATVVLAPRAGLVDVAELDPGYRAPESGATTATDVFALCATIAYLMFEAPPSPDLPLPRVIRAGLSPDPSRRPRAEDVVRALRA